MKRLQVARAPPILCLHLKRTVWLASGKLHKSTASVAFPLHMDLSALCKTRSVIIEAITAECPHVLPLCRGRSYELVAMIEHLGGPFSGHYVTYRRLRGSQWVHTSDTAVYSCSLHEVLGASPYMLFYCRVDSLAHA